jgi:hypothetical protein
VSTRPSLFERSLSLVKREDKPREETVVTGFRITLDDVINEATTIGRLSMEQETFGSKWRASISFTTSGGSYICARAKADALIIAVGLAIKEARSLGGVSKP